MPPGRRLTNTSLTSSRSPVSQTPITFVIRFPSTIIHAISMRYPRLILRPKKFAHGWEAKVARAKAEGIQTTFQEGCTAIPTKFANSGQKEIVVLKVRNADTCTKLSIFSNQKIMTIIWKKQGWKFP